MAAAEPPAKRLRAELMQDPGVIVCLNVDGLKARALPAVGEAPGVHLTAMLSHLLSVSITHRPDVIFLSELHLRARSPSRQGRVEQVVVGAPAYDNMQAANAIQTLAALLSSPLLAGWTSHFSLHAEIRGQSGVCVLLRPGLVPLSTRFSLDLSVAPGVHHPEGRVIVLEFDTLRTLFTYTPNLGNNPSRREKFDTQLHSFVSAPNAKPLLWAGDLNVSPTARDYQGAAIKRGVVAGTTTDEQERFAGILAAGGLRDEWRSRNPGVMGGWTWRGDKYLRGGVMRLDHFITSGALWPRVLRCEAVAPDGVKTRGPRTNYSLNHYFGTDHWPIWLELAPAAPSAPSGQ
jgi:exonuclease III